MSQPSKKLSKSNKLIGSPIDPNTKLATNLISRIDSIKTVCSHSTTPIGAVSCRSGREIGWCFKARPTNLHKPQG